MSLDSSPLQLEGLRGWLDFNLKVAFELPAAGRAARQLTSQARAL